MRLPLIGLLLSAFTVFGAVNSRAAEHPDAAQLRQWIDSHLAEGWAAAGVEPAPLSSDEEFVRRVYLDLVGRIPRVSEVRAFLDDEAPNRRERLIEDLLNRPDFATRAAILLANDLTPPGADTRRFGGTFSLEGWLQQRIAEDAPYDQIARELLSGDPTKGQGPQVFYFAHQQQPAELADTTARVFLGMQIGCAQCHGHPFDKWSQRDFWGFAAFFVPARVLANGAVGVPAQPTPAAEVTLPDTDEVIAPRFPDGSTPNESSISRRELLADWLAQPENPYFARAAVNRVWAALFGRGIVEPVDTFGVSTASHPELLDRLAEFFIASKYDLRAVYRLLTSTRAYQAASRGGSKKLAAELFAKAELRPLDGEQLYSSFAVLAPIRAPGGFQPGAFAFQRNAFVEAFRSVGASRTEYTAGIPQALILMNGPRLNEINDPENSELLRAISAPWFTPGDQIEAIYLATLGRLPHTAERERAREHLLTAGENSSQALGDLLWVLLNSAEFSMNH